MSEQKGCMIISRVERAAYSWMWGEEQFKMEWSDCPMLFQLCLLERRQRTGGRNKSRETSFLTISSLWGKRTRYLQSLDF